MVLAKMVGGASPGWGVGVAGRTRGWERRGPTLASTHWTAAGGGRRAKGRETASAVQPVQAQAAAHCPPAVRRLILYLASRSWAQALPLPVATSPCNPPCSLPSCAPPLLPLQMSPGALVSFMLYQQALSSSFQSIADVFSSLMAAVGAADKVRPVSPVRRGPARRRGWCPWVLQPWEHGTSSSCGAGAGEWQATMRAPPRSLVCVA